MKKIALIALTVLTALSFINVNIATAVSPEREFPRALSYVSNLDKIVASKQSLDQPSVQSEPRTDDDTRLMKIFAGSIVIFVMLLWIIVHIVQKRLARTYLQENMVLFERHLKKTEESARHQDVRPKTHGRIIRLRREFITMRCISTCDKSPHWINLQAELESCELTLHNINMSIESDIASTEKTTT